MGKLKKVFKRTSKIELIVAATPFVILLGLVRKYGVNVPTEDSWALVPLFQKVNESRLRFSDLWAQHNEHRILFPLSVLLVLGLLTKWSIKTEIAANLIVAAIGFVAIFLMIHRTNYSRAVRIVTIGAASLWFFSPVEWENWLWGWQLEWFMCVAAALWSFYLLYRLKPENRISFTLLGAVLVGYIGTYSLANGPLIWFAGLVILLFRNAKRRQYIFWSINGVIGIALYYWHYIEPAGHPALSLFYRRPVEFFEFFAALTGRPIAATSFAATLSGIMLLVIGAMVLVVLYNKKLIREYAGWLGLAVFALLSSLVTSIGRQGFGISSALTSRYTAFSILYIIALTAIIMGLLTKRDLILSSQLKERSIILSLTILMIPLIGASYYNGIQGMQGQSELLRQIKQCTDLPNPTNTCLSETYPSPSAARTMLQYVKQKGYGGY